MDDEREVPELGEQVFATSTDALKRASTGGLCGSGLKVFKAVNVSGVNPVERCTRRTAPSAARNGPALRVAQA